MINGELSLNSLEKKREKKMRGHFTSFIGKICQMWDHFFSFFPPKDSEALEFLDFQLWEVGAKRRLNGTSKSEQTDRQTDKQTYGQINLMKASAQRADALKRMTPSLS